LTRIEELNSLLELRGLIIGVMKGSVDSILLTNYSYTEADGTQSVTRRNPNDLMKWLKDVDAEIERLRRPPGGIRTFGTNRYGRGL